MFSIKISRTGQGAPAGSLWADARSVSDPGPWWRPSSLISPGPVDSQGPATIKSLCAPFSRLAAAREERGVPWPGPDSPQLTLWPTKVGRTEEPVWNICLEESIAPGPLGKQSSLKVPLKSGIGSALLFLLSTRGLWTITQRNFHSLSSCWSLK